MHLQGQRQLASRPSARASSGRCDRALIAESLHHPAVFAELFERHWPALHAFCTSRTGAVGEDLAAETFRRAFDARARYDLRYEDARPWLYGIATNLIRHHFRTVQRRGRAEGRSAARDTPAPEELAGSLERHQLGAALTEALGELPAADRDALLLFAWAELDYSEVARAMRVPVGTVRSRLHRARSRVRHT